MYNFVFVHPDIERLKIIRVGKERGNERVVVSWSLRNKRTGESSGSPLLQINREEEKIEKLDRKK